MNFENEIKNEMERLGITSDEELVKLLKSLERLDLLNLFYVSKVDAITVFNKDISKNIGILKLELEIEKVLVNNQVDKYSFYSVERPILEKIKKKLDSWDE